MMASPRPRIAAVFLAALATLAGACRDRSSGASADTSEPAPAWSAIAGDLTEAQVAQQQRAEAARDSMASRLMARLTETIGAAGPAAAIEVCSVVAPEIATDVGRSQDLRIGRTSQRLRNPENTPPEWAGAHVAGSAAEPAFFAHEDGRLGAIWPIRLGDQCVTCHGTGEQIPPEVQAALATRYPSDRATGFAPGDLRGWFWVEVDR